MKRRRYPAPRWRRQQAEDRMCPDHPNHAFGGLCRWQPDDRCEYCGRLNPEKRRKANR